VIAQEKIHLHLDMCLVCIKIFLEFYKFVEGVVGQTTFGNGPLTTLEVAVQNVAETVSQFFLYSQVNHVP